MKSFGMNIGEILDRLAMAEGIKTDADLGRLFPVERGVVSGWRRNNSMGQNWPRLIELAVKHGLSEIITGATIKESLTVEDARNAIEAAGYIVMTPEALNKAIKGK